MFKRLGSVILALTMSLMLVPVVPFAAQAESTGSNAATEAAQYEQGQAIVCFKASDSTSALSALSDDGFEYEVMLESNASNTDGASQDGLSAQADTDATTLTLVKSDTMTTEEIIAKMEARDDVEFAEPDYLIATGWGDENSSATASTDATATSTGEDSSTATTSTDSALAAQSLSAQSYTPLGDYSQFQWGLDNNGSILESTPGFDINNTDGLKGSDNVVVAVVDSGIDSTNANLSGQMINLADYGTLMTDTGAGAYGYNAYYPAATSYSHSQLSDTVGHGTHVAGIIGADGASTGTGAHGVMQDVTLLCVKLCDSNHEDYIPESSMIRGFGWLINAKENYGVNVCAANLSVGSDSGHKSLKAAFQSLEDAGIIMCISSGNESEDTSLYGNMSAQVRSDATIVVDAMEPNGTKASYSNYGAYTDVFAPGTDIYSTVSSLSAYMHFDSFRAQADGSAYIYEGFEGAGKSDVTQVASPSIASSGTKLYAFDATATDSKGAEAGSQSRLRHFLGASSLSLPVASTGSSFVSDVFDLSSVGDWSQVALGASISCSQGASVSIDFRLKDGTFTSDYMTSLASSGWTTISPSSKKVLGNISNLDTEHFQVKITFKPYMSSSAASTAYIDALGVGSGLAGYSFMSGTSMASPMATGVTGLLCAEFEGKEATQRIAARVVGGAQQTPALSGTCRSNGMVDVHKAYTNPDPVIQKAVYSNGKMVLSGWFLGSTAGTVTIGGSAATVESWTADTAQKIGTITVDVPSDISGYKDVAVTRADSSVGHKNALIQASITDFQELSIPQAAAGSSYDQALSTIPVDAGGKIVLMTSSKDVSIAGQTTFGAWAYDEDAESAGKVPWTQYGAELTIDDPAGVNLTSVCYAQGKIWAIACESYTMNMMITGELPTEMFISFDPSSGTWAQYDCSKFPVMPSLFAWNDAPYIASGLNVGEIIPSTSKDIFKISTTDAALTKVASLDHVPNSFTCISGNDLIGMNSANTIVADLSQIDASNPDKILETKAYDLPCSIDEAHDNSAAFCGTPSGAIFSGIGTVESTVDTWTFDKAAGTWTQVAKRLSYETTSDVAGATTEDALYVCGKIRDSSNLTFFRKLALYQVTATVTPEGAGTVAGTCTVADGGSATLTATAAEGYHFVRWVKGAQELGTDATLTLSNISTDYALTAVFETNPSKWSRLSGVSRYDTMAKIAQAGFADGSCSTAVLATGADFPDALAASGLAGLGKSPVVLIDGTLTDFGAIAATQAFSELSRLGVKDVIIAGGPAAVSDSIYNALVAKYGAGHVARAFGDNRVDTSLAIYNYGKTVSHGSTTGWGKTVIIATGAKFADALSISPFSYASASPIILTDNDGNLTDNAMDAIASGKFEHAVIVGGYSAVSADAQAWLASTLGGSQVVRLAGIGRYSTSAAIAQFECGQGLYMSYPAAFGYTAMTYASPCAATGQNSPDGLAGGALCGKNNSVLLLVDDSSKTSDAESSLGITALSNNKADVTSAYALGGTSAISESLYAALAASTD